MLKKSSTRPAAPAAKPTGYFQPSQEAVDAAGTPIPVDGEPKAHRSAIPAGAKGHLDDNIDGLGLTAAEAEFASGAVRIAQAQGRENPAQFSAATLARAQDERETEVITESSLAVRRLLGARVDRTKSTSRKAGFLMAGLGASEVMLNASAAIAVGDPTWVAVTTFAGIGLASLAVGWLSGSMIRDHRDRAEAGPAPSEAKQLGLAHLFRDDAARRTELRVAIGLLLAFGVAMAVLVYVLRLSAGLPPEFAVASFFVGIAAAFPAYMCRNRAADLLKANKETRAALRADARREAITQDEHTSAQALTEGVRLQVKHLILAARLGTVSRARVKLAATQSHVYGQYEDTASLPFGAVSPIEHSADIARLGSESDLVMATDFARLPATPSEPRNQKPPTGNAPVNLTSGPDADPWAAWADASLKPTSNGQHPVTGSS